jgi:hypothetical protein
MLDSHHRVLAAFCLFGSVRLSVSHTSQKEKGEPMVNYLTPKLAMKLAGFVFDREECVC